MIRLLLYVRLRIVQPVEPVEMSPGSVRGNDIRAPQVTHVVSVCGAAVRPTTHLPEQGSYQKP